MRSAQPAPVLAVASILDAEVVIEDDRWRLLPHCEAAVLAAVRALADDRPERLPLASVATIALSDDARVAELNGAFRQKPGPTNVLSFPADTSATEPGAPRYLGDVIIARETVLQEAADLGLAPIHHLQHLAIHGILHLLGFDHVTGAEAANMEALEIRVLASLGVANPYVLPPFPEVSRND